MRPRTGAQPAPNANSPTSVNTNQAAIDSLIGSSGARFVVGLGDIAYNDGGNYNYGDLEETGTSVGTPNLTEISNVFGPNYWPLTGGLPMFAVDGNHGQNSNTLTTWPESTTAANSGGAWPRCSPGTACKWSSTATRTSTSAIEGTTETASSAT